MGLFDDIIGTPEATVIPPHGRALLDTIYGGESNGYNQMYGGSRFEDYSDHPRQRHLITSGPNAGKYSTAAGAPQYLEGTWDEVKREANLPDFSPDSQDKGAWYLAQRNYKKRSGRDLDADLKMAAGDPGKVGMIAPYLSGTWTSIPGGIEPNSATGSFGRRYAQNYQRASSGGSGLFDDILTAKAPIETMAGPTDMGGYSPEQSAPIKAPVTAEGIAKQAGVGVGKAAIGMLGSFGDTEDLVRRGVDSIAPGYGAMAGKAANPMNLLTGGLIKSPTSAQVQKNVEALTGPFRQPQNTAEEYAQTAGEFVPAAGAPVRAGASLVGQGLRRAGNVLAPAGASETAGQLTKGTEAEPFARAAGAFGAATLPAAFGRAAPRAAAPTVAELKAASEAGYQSPAVTGLTVKTPAVQDWAKQTFGHLTADGFDDLLAPKTFGLLAKLQNAPAESVVTGNNLNTMRKMFGKAAGSIDDTERAAASRVIEGLDDFMSRLTPAQVISGDARAAAATLEQARGNWAAAKRSETVDRKITQAELRAAAANSGTNVANTIRQRVADIMINPAKQRGYSQAELGAMEQIVRGSTAENALRFGGNLLGGGGGLGAVTSAAVGGFATGGPGAVAPIIGFALKALSNKITMSQADKLSELIRSNSPLGRQLAGPLGDFGKAADSLLKTPSPRTLAQASLAAHNLSRNLADAGVTIGWKDILRSLQAPATGRAEGDQQ